MKFSKDDLLTLRKVLMACKLAGVDGAVITDQMVSGLHEKHAAVIFSEVKLLAEGVTLGITRLGDLEKRLSLFGDDVLVEAELTEAKKVRKLTIKGKSGKIEYRCTDERLITYPKTNDDAPGFALTFTKGEVSLLSKGVKTLGADTMTLQIKRDGSVHLECQDTSMDKFEVDLEAPANFFGEDPYSYVNPFDVGSNGVFLQLLEHAVKEKDTVQIVVMKTGNVSMEAYGHCVLAIPRIQTGE